MNFGFNLNRLIAGESLSAEMAYEMFSAVIENKETEMNQGAFLAAITAKGATAEEIAGIHRAVFELDTVKAAVEIDAPLAENSGTGMDKIKTFNISTAASVVAAACGVAMARHGSRAITSSCGTVDVAEALGVDVEMDSEAVGNSIKECGLGLFNGMSPLIHPSGLGRILSQISFGSVLNIAASLANPANPRLGVRGVNDPLMIDSVAEIMHAAGYRRCLVLHGFCGDDGLGIDEASTLGLTRYTEIHPNGSKETNVFYPEDFGITRVKPEEISASGNVQLEASRLAAILSGERNDAGSDIVLLNAALLLYIAGKSNSIADGFEKAKEALFGGGAYQKLKQWVLCQNTDNGERAVLRLEELRKAV